MSGESKGRRSSQSTGILFVAVLAFWLGLSRSAWPEEGSRVLVPREEAEILLESLRGSLEQWQRDVSFTSTYTFREGTASGHVDLDSGEVVVLKTATKASGEYHKSGPRVRLRIQPAELPKLVENLQPIGGDVTISLAGPESVDLVSDGATTMTYRPKMVGVEGVSPDIRLDGTVTVLKGDPTEQHTLKQQSATAEMLVTPLEPYGRPIRLSQLFDPDGFIKPVPPTQVDEQVYRLDDDSLEVVREAPSQSLALRFWTVPFPPVLKSIVSKTATSAESEYEYRAVLSDFQDCPGGVVARHVVATSGAKDGKIGFREWRSSDLGVVPPDSEHFEFSVPDDTRIGGLTLLPPIKDGARTLSLDSIDRKDVAELPLSSSDVIDPSAPPEPTLQRQQSPIRFWGLIVFNVACLVLLIFFGWRRRKPSSN